MCCAVFCSQLASRVTRARSVQAVVYLERRMVSYKYFVSLYNCNNRLYIISKQLLQRSDAASDPNPYTSLSQFHRAVRPSYPPYPPLAQKLPYSDSTAGLTSHASSTIHSRRPNDATSEMSTRECKTIVYLTSAARTRPKSPATPTREYKASRSTRTTGTEFLTEETNRAEFTKSHALTIPIDKDAYPARGRERFHATR